MFKTKISKYSGILFSLLGGLIASLSLFTRGIPPTHDGEYHVLRFQQFYKVLSDGNVYPRWAPDFNNGFGIPLFNYVYPLPNYVAAFFHFLGLSFIDAFKLNMILATLIGSVFFYLWTKSYWGKLGGLISSIFYTFSPYHLLDIYVRGSVGEVWGLAFFPALLWSYLNFYKSKKYIFFIFSCIFFALTLFSHNILGVIFFIFFIFYAIILASPFKSLKRDLIPLALIILLGFGISSPFWLPALAEVKYVVGLQLFDVTSNFPDIYQLIIPSWGYGLSPSDFTNPMSVQIGIANILAFFASIVILFFSKAKKILTFFIVSFTLVFFLMTSWSSFVWEIVPLFSYFQFPWRFLSLEILIASFLAGSIVSIIRKKRIKVITATLLIFITMGLSINYARGATYYQRDDKYYLTRSNFTDGTNSPGDSFNTIWLSNIPDRANHKFEFIKGSGRIKEDLVKSNYYKLQVESTQNNNTLLINTAFFPGWKASISGKEVIIKNQSGRMSIDLPRGLHEVIIFFSDTPIKGISSLLFFLSIIILILLKKVKIGIIK
ncbi:MAG: 6-pyruvoyl-tetrahydropterin synthase-related protein [Patescibacteria group bacterium]